MRKMGIGGAALGTATIAGCAGGDTGNPQEDVERETTEDLPDERRVSRTLVHLSHPEDYNPPRFATNELIVDEVANVFGVDYELNPVDAATRGELEVEMEFDTDSYTFWSIEGGDPDPGISDFFYSNGARQYQGISDPDYDALVEEQRQEFDRDARQEIVYECQNYIGEMRWEQQMLYIHQITAWNTDQVANDSVVVDNREGARWTTWSQLEPGPENDNDTVVANNFGSGTEIINPFDQRGLASAQSKIPILLFHDTLVKFDENLQRVNWVAENLETPDDTTVVAEISDEFTFHDGEPLTASDVIYTFEKLLETEPPGHQSSVTDPLESVEQTGEWEVTFHLVEPFVPFINLGLWNAQIVPEHYWEEILEETNSQDQPWEVSFSDDRPLIASGIFKYGSWNQGEQLVMEPHEEHPIAAPNVTRIQQPLATSTAEMEAFRAGEYGFMDWWVGDNQSMEETVNGNDALEMSSGPDNNRAGWWHNTTRPPHNDVAFRQAYNAVVKGQQPVIIEEIYDGFGEEASTVYSPMVEFWHNPETPSFGPGNQAAIDVLQDAGYEFDENGNLYYPEDFDLPEGWTLEDA